MTEAAAEAALIGFATDRDTVAAADGRGSETKVKTIVPARSDGYERIFRRTRRIRSLSARPRPTGHAAERGAGNLCFGGICMRVGGFGAPGSPCRAKLSRSPRIADFSLAGASIAWFAAVSAAR